MIADDLGSWDDILKECEFWMGLANDELRKGKEAHENGDEAEVRACLMRHRYIAERHRRAREGFYT